MAVLDLKEQLVSGHPDIARLDVSGTLDISSLPAMEASLHGFLKRGAVRVIVDLAGMDYISSSGLGGFLAMVDGFRKGGGDLVFIRLSDKVKKIFKVVGFNRILTLAEGEAEALEALAPAKAPLSGFRLSTESLSPHSGEAFDIEIRAVDAQGQTVSGFQGELSLKASVGIVSPSKVGPLRAGVWKGKLIVTGPGLVQLTVSDGQLSGQASVQTVETKPPATLPAKVNCPGCGVITEIKAFNVYRCRECGEVYFVDKWAHAISLRKSEVAPAAQVRVTRVSFPADVNLLSAVRVFITTVLRETGCSEDVINDIELASDEAVTNVVEHAYQFDVRKNVDIELRAQPGQVTVVLRDQGQPFEMKAVPQVDLDQHIRERRNGGLGVYLMHTLMDSVQHTHDGGQNVLTLVKKG